MKENEFIDKLNKAYFSEDCHEKEVLDHLSNLLKDVKTFVDIGASLGQYTFRANKHMEGGKIYAFEPDPIRFKELKKNCDNWELESSNQIIPIHAAVSEVSGMVEFFTTNSNLSGGLFIRDIPEKTVNWSKVHIDCVKLDDYFKDQKPDFIKIDVEGAELSVLKGSKNVLQRSAPSILIELHSFSGQVNPDEVYKFMERIGYYPSNYFGRILFKKSNSFLMRNKIIRRLKHIFKRYMNLFCVL